MLLQHVICLGFSDELMNVAIGRLLACVLRAPSGPKNPCVVDKEAAEIRPHKAQFLQMFCLRKGERVRWYAL